MGNLETKRNSPLETAYKHFQDRTAEHRAVYEEKVRKDIQGLFPEIWRDAKIFMTTGDNTQKANIAARYTLTEGARPDDPQAMRINIFTQARNLFTPPPSEQ